MRPPTASEILTVWENCLGEDLLQKTLNLVSLACPEMGIDAAAQLSIGERDAILLLLREWLFGPRLINVADCPECALRIEWDTDIGDIRLQAVQNPRSEKVFRLEIDGYDIRFRLPNSFDVLSVLANEADPSNNRLKLHDLCLLETQCNGKDCEVDELPDTVLHALDCRMALEDPQADIRMGPDCPNCLHQWEVHFDIGSYLWAEIDAWVERMLVDVHILANAYGWSEQYILGLSPVRRQAYINMVNS